MLTINFHGVEISIAGGGEEIVRAQIFCPFVSLFLIHVLCFICQLGTKTTCSASYGKEKPPITNQTAPGKKPSTQVPLVRDQPHTSHTEIRNPTLTSLSGQRRKVKHNMGRYQQENPCRRHQQKKRLDITTRQPNHDQGRSSHNLAAEQNITTRPKALTSTSETLQYHGRA